MQNFSLLRRVGDRRYLFYSSVDYRRRWMMAFGAEYIMSEGNYNVVLCDVATNLCPAHRNTLDSRLYRVAHLASSVVVDPSHGTARTTW